MPSETKFRGGVRPRRPPDRRQRRGGYRNTRADAGTGARWKDVAAFRGGKQSRIHPGRLLGGCPVLACHLDVDSAHSLRQATSAGRNLITVFFTVNTPAQNISRPRPSRHRPRRRWRCARTASATPSTRSTKSMHEKKHLLFGCVSQTRRRTHRHGACYRNIALSSRQASPTACRAAENFYAGHAFRGIASIEMRKLLCRAHPSRTRTEATDAPSMHAGAHARGATENGDREHRRCTRRRRQPCRRE